MFRSGPPQLTPGAGAPGDLLRIAGAHRLIFEDTSVTAWDPLLRLYLADMVAPYGLPLREDLLVEGAGHSFGEMAEPLIAALVPADEPVDLLVLAFAMHDLRLGRATATYLSNICPGAPFAFALCDQGNAAAFTGLRLIDAYARTGACQRALLVVLEQSALHYEPALPVPLPVRHAGVALLLDAAGTIPLRPVRQHISVTAQGVSALLGAEVAELSAGRDDVTVILGGGLSELELPGRVLRAPDGQPSTGAWWELASLSEPGELVIVAEYEPQLGYLSICAADFSDSRVLDGALAGRSR
jgi:hypothetical protein